jgi:hypothetical protein
MLLGVCDERTRRVGVVVVTDVMGDGGVPTRGERDARVASKPPQYRIAYR